MGYEPAAGNVEAEDEDGMAGEEIVPPNADGVEKPGSGCVAGTTGGGVNADPAKGVRYRIWEEREDGGRKLGSPGNGGPGNGLC